MRPILHFFLFTFLSLFLGCLSINHQTNSSQNNLFRLLSVEKTNVDFSNTLSPGIGINRNVLMYEYFYNGGGVAVSDLNGDGFDDIYFTGNMTYNKLFLNKGDMVFEDITRLAGVSGRKNTWKTGVAMADVNGDGLIDIYVCYSGQLPLKRRIDELYINQGVDNNGIPQFEEKAKEFGLANPHSSNMAAFFDYDRDGDLDLFLLTHNVESLPILNEKETKELLTENDLINGARLYRNDNNQFIDVTKKVGIQSSPLMYGLGIGISDINNDGWPDIYIANDYSPSDYLYINNQDGTFTDKLNSFLGHISFASMGIDIADINNDTLLDIFVLDMLAEDNKRQKLLNIPNNWEQFDKNVKMGFHHQYMRNMLQINNGNGTFSEIGQLAGVSNTDWSWTPLVADYNNNGWKDIFVTNGILHDITNRDFIEYKRKYIKNKNSNLQPSDVSTMLRQLPSTNLKNYIYENNSDLTFTDRTSEWGMDFTINSNGAVYSDLDNDGDLDLITNNLNEQAHIFENQASDQLNNHYLQVKLKGPNKNSYGIGSKITLYSQDEKQYLEQMPMRGYLSSVSPILHFGLGQKSQVDSLRIVWPDGKKQTISDVETDQRVTLKYEDALESNKHFVSKPTLFSEVDFSVDFFHRIKNDINDFKRQPLMVNPKSFLGPALAKADLNDDGLEDFFIGGGYGQTGKIYLQQSDGRFGEQVQTAFKMDKNSEDVDAVFFDANGDTYPDLYVASGGYHNFSPLSPSLQDRLYLNDGSGKFAKNPRALPQMYTSTGSIAITDINQDGWPDLFVGGYVIPGRYPEKPRSYILFNNGKGQFQDQTNEVAPGLQEIGMVSDADWYDLNKDGTEELIITGNWMPISIFVNEEGKLSNQTDLYFNKSYSGLWNKIVIDDFNNDGKPDLLAGNFGLNSQLKATQGEPAELYYNDFDNNGSIDPILCFYIQGTSYPYVTLDELIKQISSIQSRFSSYEEYAKSTIKDIFTKNELATAKKLQANYLKTTLFLMNEDGKFRSKKIPIESQFAPIFAINSLDFNKDGNKDLLLSGNMNEARIRFGKYDANYGILLKGDGKGNFEYIPQYKSGFDLQGDVRSTLKINETLLFGINHQPIKAYKLKSQ